MMNKDNDSFINEEFEKIMSKATKITDAYNDFNEKAQENKKYEGRVITVLKANNGDEKSGIKDITKLFIDKNLGITLSYSLSEVLVCFPENPFKEVKEIVEVITIGRVSSTVRVPYSYVAMNNNIGIKIFNHLVELFISLEEKGYSSHPKFVQLLNNIEQIIHMENEINQGIEDLSITSENVSFQYVKFNEIIELNIKDNIIKTFKELIDELIDKK